MSPMTPPGVAMIDGTQRELVHMLPWQLCPHAPQLLSSWVVSEQALVEGQTTCLAGQVLHVPALQDCPVAQMCPQAPQFFGSAFVSTHPLPSRLASNVVAASRGPASWTVNPPPSSPPIAGGPLSGVLQFAESPTKRRPVAPTAARRHRAREDALRTRIRLICPLSPGRAQCVQRTALRAHPIHGAPASIP